MSNTVARPYVVTFQTIHPRTGEVQTHESKVEAYEQTEAVAQALIEADAKFSLVEQGYKMKVLSCRPDTAAAHGMFVDVMRDIALAMSTAKSDEDGG